MLHPSGKERWTAQQAIMTLSQADLDGIGSLKGAWDSSERSGENGGRSGSGDKGSGLSSSERAAVPADGSLTLIRRLYRNVEGTRPT